MVFSKTFGYALRGILYVAIVNEGKPTVNLEEIAKKLSVPRHFLGKVMKKLVKDGVINSLRGPRGGFFINEETKKTSLLRLVEITGEPEEADSCVLRFRKCNAVNPCPLHGQVELLRQQWHSLLISTTIGDLLPNERPGFIRSIAIL